MGILDKIMFWKKKEEPILEKGLDDFSLDESGDMGMDAGTGLDKPVGLDEPMGLDDSMGMEEPMGMDHASLDVPTKPAVPLTGAIPEPTVASAGNGRDMELVLAKLDAIKARLDNVDAKLMRIEKMAQEE